MLKCKKKFKNYYKNKMKNNKIYNLNKLKKIL